MGSIAFLFGKILRLERIDTVALILVVMTVNSGNYGLTLNELRYGSEGLARAIVFFTVSTLLVFTLGVFVASTGRATAMDSLKRLATLPAFYAVLLAVLVYRYSWQLPGPVMHSIEVAGNGAIPVMLIVLGMQIADLRSLEGLKLALPASILRLVAGPAIGILVAGWLGLNGVTRSAAILEASMPTAVITTIVAMEFDIRPRLVTTVVVLSTLLSATTLPLLIVLGDL